MIVRNTVTSSDDSNNINKLFSCVTPSYNDKGYLRVSTSVSHMPKNILCAAELLSVGSIIQIYWRHYECGVTPINLFPSRLYVRCSSLYASLSPRSIIRASSATNDVDVRLAVWQLLMNTPHCAFCINSLRPVYVPRFVKCVKVKSAKFTVADIAKETFATNIRALRNCYNKQFALK